MIPRNHPRTGCGGIQPWGATPELKHEVAHVKQTVACTCRVEEHGAICYEPQLEEERTGESKPKSAVGNWQRSLRKLFKLADVSDGHAHRFRDTFAVELLLSGVPMERVSVLLGHRSIRLLRESFRSFSL